ncbi:MAG: DUF1800 domain-containing protein [Bacteroidota bacterium]
MRRREFLEKFRISGKRPEHHYSKPIKAQSLDEYTEPLDLQKAAHLLRRLTFAPTWEQVQLILGKTASEAIDIILGTGNEPLPDGYQDLDWLDEVEENPLETGSVQIRFEIEGRHKSRYRELNSWWLDQMRKETFPAMEKLTLLWHTVWTCEFTYDTLSLIPPPLMYRNNQTLREGRMANYKDMAENITLDGAMLLYQSLHYSTKASPNENYMRELVELFLMGIGHYTEGDIREGSRALTGWRAAAHLGPHPNGYFNTYFSPQDHDTGGKTVMKQDISPRDEADNTEDQVRLEEVRGLIDILFEERPEPIAGFICEKIYKYFVYSDPGAVDFDIVGEMAQTFINNDFELKPVFRQLFTSQHFFSEDIIGGQIKTPPEYIVGLERMLNVDYQNAREAVFNLEMVLYDPPDVGSWAGYRSWISTTTYPLRARYGGEILDLADNTALFAMAEQFGIGTTPDAVLNAILAYMLPKMPDSEKTARFKTAMLNDMDDAAWEAAFTNKETAAAVGLRTLVNEIILAPDFQLS